MDAADDAIKKKQLEKVDVDWSQNYLLYEWIHIEHVIVVLKQ